MSFVSFVVINTLHKLFARHPLIIMARKGSIKKRTERSDLNKYSIFNLQFPAYSLIYGTPIEAGGVARPMALANTTMVST